MPNYLGNKIQNELLGLISVLRRPGNLERLAIA